MESRTRVLIIDDESDFTELVCHALNRTGRLDVSAANSAEEGYDLANRELPDIILLDILMPGEDGFSVLKRLKENSGTVSIPVVMVTALTSHEARLRALRLYCEGYLEKPCSTEDIIDKIDVTLDRRRQLRLRFNSLS
jgi:DNA-binding response OmpR family regulator